jgi:transcriptional regulator with XRE-family HTH domain
MFGEQVKAWREAEGISQGKLAEECTRELEIRNIEPRKLTKQWISLWETGKATPHPLTLEWLIQNAKNERVQRFARFALDILIKQEVEKALEE